MGLVGKLDTFLLVKQNGINPLLWHICRWVGEIKSWDQSLMPNFFFFFVIKFSHFKIVFLHYKHLGLTAIIEKQEFVYQGLIKTGRKLAKI
jgi:hypothetical protein